MPFNQGQLLTTALEMKIFGCWTISQSSSDTEPCKNPVKYKCGVDRLQSVTVHLQSDLRESCSCKLAKESTTDA